MMFLHVVYSAANNVLLVDKKCYFYTGLGRLRGFQELQVSRISRLSAHEGGKIVSSKHRPSLACKEVSWYLCMLEAQWIRTMCVRNFNDPIRNRTGDLLFCSENPQLTVPTSVPLQADNTCEILTLQPRMWNSSVGQSWKYSVCLPSFNRKSGVIRRHNPYWIRITFDV
jgi:hypothetical protein